ncbi:hypothetical protein LCGC14_2585550 [marine sediment metagenome]|uniref:Uncharacterized protein n=1 Tax=marine sediment metagenome TaxID=412755 RepID=A0A0F9B138_9ZZZZ
MSTYDKTDKEFIAYLISLSLDLRESEHIATADDVEEAARRISRVNNVLDLLWNALRNHDCSFDLRQRNAMSILRATKDHRGTI